MNEFIEKLIGRLEERKRETEKDMISSDNLDAMNIRGGKVCAFHDAIQIVNELAEEYKDRTIIDGQYCWQNCGATEHCKECNRLGNGTIDYFENYDCLAEEYKGGWIPCSERLPETKKEVLIFADDNSIFVGHLLDDGFSVYDGEGWIGLKHILAWQPLPEPYIEK